MSEGLCGVWVFLVRGGFSREYGIGTEGGFLEGVNGEGSGREIPDLRIGKSNKIHTTYNFPFFPWTASNS